jgi:hypothetical protein
MKAVAPAGMIDPAPFLGRVKDGHERWLVGGIGRLIGAGPRVTRPTASNCEPWQGQPQPSWPLALAIDVFWRGKLIFVRHLTEKEVADMKAVAPAGMIDPALVSASGAIEATKGQARAAAPTTAPAPVARNRKSRRVDPWGRPDRQRVLARQADLRAPPHGEGSRRHEGGRPRRHDRGDRLGVGRHRGDEGPGQGGGPDHGARTGGEEQEPFVASMAPDAETIAAGAPIDVDLTPIADGQIVNVFWPRPGRRPRPRRPHRWRGTGSPGGSTRGDARRPRASPPSPTARSSTCSGAAS